MSSKKWFPWLLPFGDRCDPRCEEDLHNTYCFVFGVVFVVLTLAAIAVLRQCTRFAIVTSLASLWLFFGVTLKAQRNFIIQLWCWRCLEVSSPVCPRCGSQIEFDNNSYIFYNFLSVSVYDGAVRKCRRCGYSEKNKPALPVRRE